MQTEIDKLKIEIEELKEYTSLLEAENESKDQEIEKLKQNTQTSINSSDKELVKQINDLNELTKNLQQQIEEKDMEIQMNMEEHQKEIESLKKGDSSSIAEIKKLNQQIQQLQQTIENQQKQIDQAGSLKEQIEEYRIQINQQEQINNNTQQLKEQVVNVAKNQDDDIALLLEQISQLEAVKNENEDKIKQLEETNHKLNEQIEQQQKDQELLQPNESNSEKDDEIQQMQEMITTLQQDDEEQKKQINLLKTQIKDLQKQLQLKVDSNYKLQIDLEQKVLEIREEKEKVLSLEDELSKIELKLKEVVESKQKISSAYQQASQDLLMLEQLQSDNAQLQLIVNQQSEELNQMKTNNSFETLYHEINKEFEDFKELIQVQFQNKDNDLAIALQELSEFESCKEQLAIYKYLPEKLNQQQEVNKQLQEKYQNCLEQIQHLSNNQASLSEIENQCQFFKQQSEQLKSELVTKQERILELEAQVQNLQTIECESPKKLQKLQSEFAENRNEYFNFKEQATRELHLFKQNTSNLQNEMNQMKTMIDAFLSTDQDFSSKNNVVQEYYEKLIDFSDEMSKIIQKKDQEFASYKEMIENKHKINHKDQLTQIQVETQDQSNQTLNQVCEQTNQTEIIENSLAGSMWLNNDTIQSKDDQFLSMKKKNEDLDSLLKNYEKEVTNLKQHNKMLQKKIDSNTKPNAQDRLGKRTSLFEPNLAPRKSKQFHLNLCESQAIDDQQREIHFMKELMENLKKENKQFQTQITELSSQITEYKQLQEKYIEEQNRLEDQLQSQILINQTKNKSVDYNNQTNISQITNTVIQLNQIELFLIVKSQRNFQFPYIEFSRKQIKFFSQGKTRIEKQIYETFQFEDVFLDQQKMRSYFSFYGKISLDQSRMFLIVGQSKTQKKYMMMMFLDLYYCMLKEQKLKQNLKFKVQIQYQEKVGNSWTNLDQLNSEIIISNDNIDQSHQQLELSIQNIKFYLFGKNQQAQQFGKEKIRQLTITYSILFSNQTYSQQFIITTIPMVPRLEFPRFLSKICGHKVQQNFKYYCLLTINPILLHYNQTVDIMYFAKIVYAQNNQEELNKQMKIDDESVKQVRQATGQVVIKNQEIDILKRQLEYIKKQLNDQQQKIEIKQQLNQQIINHLSNLIVDIKMKMSHSKPAKSPKQCPENLFFEKLIAQLENIVRRLTPIQQALNTDRSISPQIQNC